MFGQSFNYHDIVIVGLLVVLEGVLSIDNALVLGILARRVRKEQQKKALTYGLIGAFFFRFIAIATATFLLKWGWVKLAGGGYLIWISFKHFFLEEPHDHHIAAQAAHAQPDSSQVDPDAAAPITTGLRRPGFWSTVAVIELTDIAFAVDSILAAIGVVGSPPPLYEGGPNPKLWVVITGGFLGVILMRFAAILFIKLLEAFPRFEDAAYLLVWVIGLKLLTDWSAHHWHFNQVVNFHDVHSVAFWVFWAAMLACFSVGFVPSSKHKQQATTT